MILVSTHRDPQAVRSLPFCYLCGAPFGDNEERTSDHVPPKTCFAACDREGPLILSSHARCNTQRSVTDKQIGQLIGLIHGKVPKAKRDHTLNLKFFGPKIGAVTNVNISAEVWRWIMGFHAALYHEPCPHNARRALVTPFPSAPLRDGGQLRFDPIKPQHQEFVSTIKINRVKRNLDTIRCNRGKVVYECVWCRSDDQLVWLCIFAIDIYGWKDLGNHVVQPARGCAGCYTLPDGHAPINATRGATSAIIIPNSDKLDPFSP
jgi:hypothetical protein